jgi:protein-L-isoaspartate(D-aspartate) O-methyltransferase
MRFLTFFAFILLSLAPNPPAFSKPVTTSIATATPTPLVWDYQTYLKAFKASGRKSRLTDKKFDHIETKRQAALDNVKSYMMDRAGEMNEDILKAFSEVPREYFHYDYQKDMAFSASSYDWPARPWAIGYGSALSDYPGQVYMIQLAQPEPTDTVLEIGTGSGYNIALLSRLVKEAYSIEIIKPLGTKVANIFKPLGYNNVHTKVGDGYYGWDSVKGGFDIIIVTCAAQFVPPALLKQLKPHGRMVIPIGQPFRGQQVLYVYTKDSQGKVHCRKDVGVFFIPMTGKMQKESKPGDPQAVPTVETASESDQ